MGLSKGIPQAWGTARKSDPKFLLERFHTCMVDGAYESPD